MKAARPPRRLPDAGSAVLIAACAALMVVYAVSMLSQCGGLFQLPLDDAYIYLQYAARLAEGHVFSYSPGDRASTGFTSPLYLLALAPAALVGLRGDALAVWAFVLNGGFLIASALLVRQVLGRVATSGQAFAGSLLLLLSGPLTWGFFSGMEIGLVVVLLLATVRAAGADVEEGVWRRTPTVLSFLALSRPEAGVVALLLSARGLAGRGTAMSRKWRLLLPFGAVAAWMLLNFALTGRAVSSTGRPKSPLFAPYFSLGLYVALVGGWLRRTILALALGVTPEADPAVGGAVAFVPPLALVLGALGGAALLARERKGGHPGPAEVLLTSAVAGPLAVAFSSASWSHHGRYLIPFLAPVLVLLVPGAGRIAALAHRWAPGLKEGAVRSALLLVLVISQAVTLVEFVPQYGADARGFLEYRKAGIFIRDRLPASARVAVLDAGIVAFYGRKPVVDLYGLTTPWMTESTFYSSDYAGSKFEAMVARPVGERPGYFLVHRIRYDERGDEAHLAPFRTEPVRSFGSPPPGVPSVGVDLTLFRLDWSRLRPAPLPCEDVGAVSLLDGLNVADVADEKSHRWRFRPSVPGTFTSNRLTVAACGRVTAADGVRGIEGAEEFSLDADGPGPGLLIVRMDLIFSPMEVVVNGMPAGMIEVRNEPGRWLEAHVPLAAGILRAGRNAFRISGRYRVARYWLFAARPQS